MLDMDKYPTYLREDLLKKCLENAEKYIWYFCANDEFSDDQIKRISTLMKSAIIKSNNDMSDAYSKFLLDKYAIKLNK